jgi:hypothetical protein
MNTQFQIVDHGNNFRDLVYVGENQLKANDVVLELKGEILQSPTRESIQLGPNQHIFDKTGQFINHACNPTCKIVGRTVVVIDKLSKGDSVTFDYNSNEDVVSFPFYCNCHHKLISGKLSNKN